MSQAKVDQRKQEKYNRKNAPKQSKIKKYFSYGCATVIAAVIVVYIGYSIAVETGLYTPEEPTTAFVSTVTSKELAEKLESSGDALGFYKKAKGETATTEAATEEATTEKATKKKDK